MEIIYEIKKEKLKKTHAFFCDVDGTLITSKGEIKPLTKEKVIQLKDMIPFILTSGRTYKGLLTYHNELKLTTPYITLNGAVIVDNKKIIDFIYIEDKEKMMVLDYLANYFNQCSINIFSLTKWYSNSLDNIYMQREYSITHFLPDQIIDIKEETQSIIANNILFIGNIEACDEVTAWGKKNLPSLYVIHNSPTYVEFFSKRASKGDAIKKYCKRKSYPINLVLGAGDALIDETMMQACGFKAAPANADKLISSLANIHLPSNEENAIGRLADDILKMF